MNFKPVGGAQLREFDDETIQLYKKRASDERLTDALLKMDRRKDRNNLPVVSSVLTEWQQHRESYLNTFLIKSAAFLGFSVWSFKQFSKAYFPYGIILRNSIPQTL